MGIGTSYITVEWEVGILQQQLWLLPSETPKMALAPNLAFIGCTVQFDHQVINVTLVKVTSSPMIWSAMISSTLEQAFITPFAKIPTFVAIPQFDGFVRSSEAPEGTAALPTNPSSVNTSTSMLDCPLNLRISLAITSMIALIYF